MTKFVGLNVTDCTTERLSYVASALKATELPSHLLPIKNIKFCTFRGKMRSPTPWTNLLASRNWTTTDSRNGSNYLACMDSCPRRNCMVVNKKFGTDKINPE